MLKRSYEKKDQIPSGYENLYEEKDGKFVLKVEFEGLVGKEKVDEFRQNNIDLKKQLDALKDALGETDPEKVKAYLADVKKKEEAAALKAGDIDKLLETRTAEMRKAHDTALTTAKKEIEKLTAELTKLVVENGIRAAAAAKKVLGTAVEDVLMRGKSVFQMKDGKAVAIGADGQPMFGKDGSALTMEAWVDSLTSSAPHLFEASSGGGASNAGGGASGGQTNPWKKDSFNLTQQGKIAQTNPALAKRLMQEAGLQTA